MFQSLFLCIIFSYNINEYSNNIRSDEMVKLSKEVAEDLEYKREIGMNNFILVDFLLYHRGTKVKKSPLALWLEEDIENRFEVLLSALVNGYEIE